MALGTRGVWGTQRKLAAEGCASSKRKCVWSAITGSSARSTGLSGRGSRSSSWRRWRWTTWVQEAANERRPSSGMPTRCSSVWMVRRRLESAGNHLPSRARECLGRSCAEKDAQEARTGAASAPAWHPAQGQEGSEDHSRVSSAGSWRRALHPVPVSRACPGPDSKRNQQEVEHAPGGQAGDPDRASAKAEGPREAERRRAGEGGVTGTNYSSARAPDQRTGGDAQGER